MDGKTMEPKKKERFVVSYSVKLSKGQKNLNDYSQEMWPDPADALGFSFISVFSVFFLIPDIQILARR